MCVCGGGGVIKESVLKLLKTGVGKGRNCLEGEGVLKVSPPLLPIKVLIVVLDVFIFIARICRHSSF